MENTLSDLESRRVLLDLLEAFDHICAGSGLRYSLAYGSLLGAERHQGFIPWDDDVDVLMPRADYERLLAQYREGALPPRFALWSPYNKSDYYYTFAKLVDTRTWLKEPGYAPIGLYVDIFPVDVVPAFAPAALAKRWFVGVLLRILRARLGTRSPTRFKRMLRGCLYPVSLFFRRRALCRLIDKVAQLGSGRRSVGVQVHNAYRDREFFPAEWLDGVDYIKFEHLKVAALKRRAAYLRSVYGDYMQLPPEAERRPRHDFQVLRLPL